MMMMDNIVESSSIAKPSGMYDEGHSLKIARHRPSIDGRLPISDSRSETSEESSRDFHRPRQASVASYSSASILPSRTLPRLVTGLVTAGITIPASSYSPRSASPAMSSSMSPTTSTRPMRARSTTSPRAFKATPVRAPQHVDVVGIHVGQVYSSRDQLVKTCRQYAVQQGITVAASDAAVVCIDASWPNPHLPFNCKSPCSWRIDFDQRKMDGIRTNEWIITKIRLDHDGNETPRPNPPAQLETKEGPERITPSISPPPIVEGEENIEPAKVNEGVLEATDVPQPKQESLSPVLRPLGSPVAADVTNDATMALADDLDIGMPLQQDVPTASQGAQSDVCGVVVDKLVSPFELQPSHDDGMDMSSGCSPAPVPASPPKYVRPADVNSSLPNSTVTVPEIRPAIGAVSVDEDGSDDELLQSVGELGSPAFTDDSDVPLAEQVRNGATSRIVAAHPNSKALPHLQLADDAPGDGSLCAYAAAPLGTTATKTDSSPHTASSGHKSTLLVAPVPKGIFTSDVPDTDSEDDHDESGDEDVLMRGADLGRRQLRGRHDFSDADSDNESTSSEDQVQTLLVAGSPELKQKKRMPRKSNLMSLIDDFPLEMEEGQDAGIFDDRVSDKDASSGGAVARNPQEAKDMSMDEPSYDFDAGVQDEYSLPIGSPIDFSANEAEVSASPGRALVEAVPRPFTVDNTSVFAKASTSTAVADDIPVPYSDANYDESNNDAAIAAILEDDQQLWCTCRGPEVGGMIKCCGPACKIEWFHLKCVNIPHDRIPKRHESWTCLACTLSEDSELTAISDSAGEQKDLLSATRKRKRTSTAKVTQPTPGRGVFNEIRQLARKLTRQTPMKASATPSVTGPSTRKKRRLTQSPGVERTASPKPVIHKLLSKKRKSNPRPPKPGCIVHEYRVPGLGSSYREREKAKKAERAAARALRCDDADDEDDKSSGSSSSGTCYAPALPVNQAAIVPGGVSLATQLRDLHVPVSEAVRDNKVDAWRNELPADSLEPPRSNASRATSAATTTVASSISAPRIVPVEQLPTPTPRHSARTSVPAATNTPFPQAAPISGSSTPEAAAAIEPLSPASTPSSSEDVPLRAVSSALSLHNQPAEIVQVVQAALNTSFAPLQRRVSLRDRPSTVIAGMR